jgi:hypothetical protein
MVDERQLPLKFLRDHTASTRVPEVNHGGSGNTMMYRMKMMYEFWGFCVNGSDELNEPGSGSFASYPAEDSIDVYSGFQSGSALIASGSDGVTEFATQFFTSSLAPFSSSHVGMHIVTWKSGSESTDDSVYEITEYITPDVIRVNTKHGGTPLDSRNGEPWFTDRTNINYRLIDFKVAHDAGYGTSRYMVLNLSTPERINPNQRVKPQFRIQTVGASFEQVNFSYYLSPSGSWDPATKTFADGAELVDTASTTGGGLPSGRVNMTFVADKCFFWQNGCCVTTGRQNAVYRGNPGTRGCFHVEVPVANYPHEVDPNPLAAAAWTNGMINNSTARGQAAFHMIASDGSLQRYETYVFDVFGMISDRRIKLNIADFEIFDEEEREFFFSKYDKSLRIYSGMLVSNYGAPDFSLGRVRLRYCALFRDVIPQSGIIGDDKNNQWLYTGYDGILIPWDGARLTQHLIPLR